MANYQGSMEERMASVRRCLLTLSEKYFPGMDILELGDVSEDTRKTVMLIVIDKLIGYQEFTIIESLHPLEILQSEVWEMTRYKTREERKDCPLHDTEAVQRMPLTEQVAVEWMRDLCRYGADVEHNIVSTIKMLFPEIKGDMTIMDESLIEFVMTTPYRKIAGEVLANVVFGIRRHLCEPPEEIAEWVDDVELEVIRYSDEQLSDVEVFIMRIMSMLSYAFVNLHIKDYWKKEGEVK